AEPAPDPSRTRAAAAGLASFVDDPFAHARRASESVPLGALALGGAAPVLAELALGAPPAEPEKAAWQLADALAARREVACEGLRLDVDDDAALARARAFATALARHAIAAPLALRMPLALAAAGKDAGA